ncbi:MAG: S8 family serine peptidase [Bdellovibrionales bacterium]|nr:S8 family serine peptidase [Bdellovibrionales bacterium]
MIPTGSKIEDLGVNNWLRVQMPQKGFTRFNLQALEQNPQILHVQPNFRLSLLEKYQVKNPRFTKQAFHPSLGQGLFGDDLPFPFPGGGDDEDKGDGGGLPWPGNGGSGGKIQDNPPFPALGSSGSGVDTLYPKQWGMSDLGVLDGWKTKAALNSVIVAVIDTGVDYTHEDLKDNIWRNPGEMGQDSQGRDKSTNGIDDDGNGFVDDLVGWDFASNDNKPFDLTVPVTDLLFGGGNPGHGTHVAGCVAARSENGKGVIGVGDNSIKIMALRFLTEKGQGTSADAIKAIRYAVDNGAKISNNSWGSEGEDPAEASENKALRDAITYAESKGSLFIAAAGNGHSGVGYDNDTDSKPSFPSSYPHDIIISVAAIDKNDNMGSFSNWGLESVDLAAPGVAVFSTMVGNRYNDLVIDLFGMKVTWDGTSMASPHVAGAAALYWSRNPSKTWKEVKDAVLDSVHRIPSLNSKVLTGGKLDVRHLMNQ